jgi:hypothetical protein
MRNLRLGIGIGVVPLRVMLDSNIYDRVAERKDILHLLELAVSNGKILIVQTHI